MRDIFDSARFGSVDEVKRAVERGQDVNATDRSGDTPLCHAARKGHLAVSQLLLEIGAAASGAGSQGYTPLHYSATNGYGSLSQLLLENGAEIDAVDEKGRTPLFFAVKYGRSEVAALLLDSGADVGGVHVEVEGKTAIDRCTDAEVLRLLVQAADQRVCLQRKIRVSVIVIFQRGRGFRLCFYVLVFLLSSMFLLYFPLIFRSTLLCFTFRNG